MSVRPKGEKRKQRWVAATDAEWTLICRAADAAGVPRSEFVVRSCLAGQVSAGSTDAGLSSSVLRRAVHAVLVLEELERRRLENLGGEPLWRLVVAETDAWIDREADLG